MGIFKRFTHKKTNFKAGGLKEPLSNIAKFSRLKYTSNFVAPKFIDSRGMCLASSDQGFHPSCAGYTTAGYLEVQNWKKNHYPEQLDGLKIYKKAKELDPYNGDGTTLDYTVKAAIELGLLKGDWNIEYVTSKEDVKYAVHEFSVFMAGFMINEAWNFVSKKTGYISTSSGADLGGHAVLVCWYDEDAGIGWQNSWGSSWGWNGFGRMTWKQFNEQFQAGVIINKNT